MLSLQTAPQPMIADTPEYRPAVHFTPAQNWMNDPNGLVFADGVYHLYFQHYPEDRIWGPMHWGHATSRDLLHWEEQPIALYPDALGMIFSGSIVVDSGNTSGLGQGGVGPWIAIFTHHDLAAEKAGSLTYQCQSIAYSLDQGQSWTKYPGNPVLPNPGIKNFRDPKVSWHSETKRWVMVLAGGDRMLFFSSENLIDWRPESELTSFDVAEGNVLECPDLLRFERNGQTQWALLVSVYTGAPNGGSGTHYVVGDFDGRTFTPEHDDIRWLDYGPDNYAGVTFHNAPGNPLLMGWMSNWAYAQQVPTAPWRSAMTLPRTLELVEVNGQALLRQSVATDIGCKTIVVNDMLSMADAPMRLRIENAAGDSFCLKMTSASGEALRIGFDAKIGEYYIDRRAAGLSDFSAKFSIRATAPAKEAAGAVELFIDRSSVELFADDGLTVMTSLVFPREPYSQAVLSRQ